MPRIVIAGGPKAGKTTLAGKLKQGPAPIVHTDDWRHEAWTDVPDRILEHLQELGGSWVLEGVQALRVLRRALDQGADLGVDRVVYIRGSHEKLTPRQSAMAKGVHTQWVGLKPRLRESGVFLHVENVGMATGAA